MRAPFLQVGDTIAIMAPARFVLQNDIQNAVDWLIGLGFKVKLGNTIGKVWHQFAGTDIFRAQDFNQLVEDTTVKAIWFARGGYGCVRITDQINWHLLLANPKWLIGYSDITVLHAKANALGLQTLHAEMPINFGKELKDIQQFNAIIDIICGKSDGCLPITNLPDEIKKLQIIGGNLSVWYSMLGSSSLPNPNNRILFIEDLEEYYYHIDRMLRALYRSGCFKGLKGIALGGFSELQDNKVLFGISILEMLTPLLPSKNFNIFTDVQAGHINLNMPFVLG